MSTKYIVVEDFHKTEHMIIFGEEFQHSAMANVFNQFKIRSGGFVNPYTGECFGQSISLGLKSRAEDCILAQQVLGIDRPKPPQV